MLFSILNLFLSQCNQIHDFGTPLYSYESPLGTKGNIYTSNNKYIQGESKKVWFTALGKKVYLFLCNSSVWCFFNTFRKFKIFFGTLMVQKNPRTLFYSQKQKFRKAKMCILTISIEISNFIKIESQNHRKLAKL